MTGVTRTLPILLSALALLGCAKAQPPAAPTPIEAVAQRDFAALDRELLTLLQAEQFDRLDALLTDVMREHEADPRKEQQVEVAFDAFYRPNFDLSQSLDKWVAAMPDSYNAHLARASYYTALAWAARQGRYARHTSDAQFASMRVLFDMAKPDVLAARRLNPRQVLPIVLQMQAIINDGDSESMQRLYEEGLQIDPTSLSLRWQYLWSLLPRWGGSIEQMEKVVAGARPYYARHPALRILEGRVDAEIGSQALLDRDCERAKSKLDAAVTVGEHWYYLHESAMQAFYCDRALTDAIQKLRRAVVDRPNAINVYQTASILGRSLYGTGQYAEAIDVLSIQLTVDADDGKARQLRGDSYFRLGRIDEALRDFEANVQADPENAEYAQDLDVLQQLVKNGTCVREPKQATGVWQCHLD